MNFLAIAYILTLAVMSLVAFATYGIDKRLARTGKRRVSEKSLHLVGLFGGWPGALAGQRVFHHKTKKLSFRIVFWLVTALHIGVVGGIAYLLLR